MKTEKTKTSIVVIETHKRNGNVEWGISLDGGHNPSAKDYFKMPDEKTAFRLKKKLSAKFPPVTFNNPICSPDNKV